MSDVVKQSIQSRVHLDDFTQWLYLKPIGVMEALDIAEEVGVQQNQFMIDPRLLKLSRFIRRSLCADVTQEHCGVISIISTGDPDGVAALRCGELVGLSPGMDQVGGASRARELATALLMCAELAESSVS